MILPAIFIEKKDLKILSLIFYIIFVANDNIEK